MVIHISDVADHFSCDYRAAIKITNILLKSEDVSMVVDDIVDFSFCGMRHSLIRTDNDWVLTRSVTVRSENLEDVLK